MNKLLFKSNRKLVLPAVVVGTCLLVACADTYSGDETFESSVRNAQLNSPAEADIAIAASTDGSQQTISWPVVHGAGGYELAVYDGGSGDVIVKDTIDGCSRTISREEDTNYRLELRTLGNPQLNNQEAAAPTVKNFSTFTESYGKIPAGDLYRFFQENPIPDTEDIANELNYDLEPGGRYTLSKSLNFNFHKVVLRTSDKSNHATVVMGDSANFIVSNDFTLKYVDVDASTCVKPVMEAYKYDTDPDDIMPKPKNYFLIDFVRIQDSNIKGVQGSLFYDNNKAWAVVSFLIKNSVIHMNTTTSFIKNESFIAFQGGGIKDFSIANSTIYQTGEGNSKYFLRYNNSIRIDRLGYETSDHTTLNYTNNTFYKVANGQWANYSGISNYSAYTVLNNIWVDCADGQIARRMMGNGRMGTNSTASWGNNTYWQEGEAKDNSQYDTGFILSSDPAFADPANGNFTPTGSEQLERRTGDPRWLSNN